MKKQSNANQNQYLPNDGLTNEKEPRMNNPETDQALSPEDRFLTPKGQEPHHENSLTGIATDAMRTGVYPEKMEEEIPGSDELYQAGDVDIDPLENAYSGDEIPGGDMPTPDQNLIDSIGQAYGITDIDNGSLISVSELIDKRDENRLNQEVPPSAK